MNGYNNDEVYLNCLKELFYKKDPKIMRDLL